MWIPLVLVGSVLYWTLALGLGANSLSLLSGASDEELVTCPGTASTASVTLPSAHGRGPLDVHLVSGSELTGFGGNHSLDDGAGRLPAIDQSPPPPLEDSIGRTSY
jgi:hypothetical protein